MCKSWCRYSRPDVCQGIVANMTRRPARFTQADVARTIKGALRAGLSIGRIEIDASGAIILIAGAQEAVEAQSPLDAWKARKDACQAQGRPSRPDAARPAVRSLPTGTHGAVALAWTVSPGTPHFIASYNRAIADVSKTSPDTLDTIITKFVASDAFLSLAPRTQSDYRKLLRSISNEFGTLPVSALPDKRARGTFMEWRDTLALHSRRQADYAWSVFARLLSWALDRRLVDANPCAKGGRLYNAARNDHVWSYEDEAAFKRVAPAPLRLALMLALWTGQRQGDLLRLLWSAYDGETIRLRQGKTGRKIVVPVGAPLKSMLDTTERHSPLILVNTRGVPWTPNGFRASWRKACAAAGVSGVKRSTICGERLCCGCFDQVARWLRWRR